MGNFTPAHNSWQMTNALVAGQGITVYIVENKRLTGHSIRLQKLKILLKSGRKLKKTDKTMETNV